jgi:hypothetical protein
MMPLTIVGRPVFPPAEAGGQAPNLGSSETGGCDEFMNIEAPPTPGGVAAEGGISRLCNPRWGS